MIYFCYLLYFRLLYKDGMKMKKFGMIFLAITLMLTGCGKDNKKESNTIIIENTSNKLSQEQANKYAKSIQTIIVETYIGINSIENFKVIFEDEKDKIKVIGQLFVNQKKILLY